MPDLRVDTAVMRRSQTTLGDIGHELDTATAHLGDISAASIAQSDLRDRLEELGSSWGIGLKRLGGYAAEAATALAGVADSFEQLDTELAKGMQQASAPEGGSAR